VNRENNREILQYAIPNGQPLQNEQPNQRLVVSSRKLWKREIFGLNREFVRANREFVRANREFAHHPEHLSLAVSLPTHSLMTFLRAKDYAPEMWCYDGEQRRLGAQI
jgi:hypothetical protein